MKPRLSRILVAMLAVIAGIATASCAGVPNTTVTKTIVKPPDLGAARGEAANPQPVGHRVNGHGNPENATFTAAAGCGTERWAVKTGTDPGASQVNTTPQDTTVADLASIIPPANPTDRVAPTETTTFHLHATITAVKQEADSDYHLALSDGQGNTMIAESPSTSCDQGSQVATQIATVRSTINAACPNIGPSYQNVSIPADLTGIGFFDRLHGQRGVAPNGIELHPLLAITLSGHC